MKVVVVGLGYVGLSTAVSLAQGCDVTGLDIVQDRIDQINNGEVPFRDELLEEYLKNKELRFKAVLNDGMAYAEAKFVFIALPTDYDETIAGFDTKAIEQEIEHIYNCNPEAVIVIKSTVPVGFTARMQKKYAGIRLLVSPEFLRAGMALYDCLNPSRIVVGTDLKNDFMAELAANYLTMLKKCILMADVQTLVVNYSEAEAIKLFSNSYLALRVAFFNELDTYAEAMELDSKHIIEGVCMDKRIGSFYNNPSFGYGGYCLPKDTKELLHCYGSLPQAVIKAAVDGNKLRAAYIAQNVLKRLPNCSDQKAEPVVGIYTLSAKSGTTDSRESAMINVIEALAGADIKLLVYDPGESFAPDIPGIETINNLNVFKQKADIILANRYDKWLDDVKYKVYTRDVFGRD